MEVLEQTETATWIEQLNATPPMGVGLGYDVNAAGLDYRDLFKHLGGQVDYLESHPIYRQQTIDEIYQNVGREVPFILHYNDLGICNPSLDITDHAEIINGLSKKMSPPWFVEDFGYWALDGRQFYSFMPPVLTEDSLDATCRNMSALQEAVALPYLPENPAFIFSVGGMHILEFSSELSRRTNCGLLLDVGHLYSFQVARGLDPMHAVELLPMDKIYEIHVAGGAVVNSRTGYRYYDDNHSRPIMPVVLEMLAELVGRAPNLRALTVEVDFNLAATGIDDPLQIAVENFQTVREIGERNWKRPSVKSSVKSSVE